MLLKQDSIHEHCEGVYVPRNKLTQFEGISVNIFGHEKLWPNYEVKKKKLHRAAHSFIFKHIT